jgi:hypothetical protein
MPKRIAPHSLSIVLLCAAVPAFCQANYRANLTATSDYIATQQLADGATTEVITHSLPRGSA